MRLFNYCAGVFLWCGAAQAAVVSDPGFAEMVITGSQGLEFSSLARTGGDRYLAVTDSGDGKLYRLDIAVDLRTGAVTSAAAQGLGTPLAGALDPESVRRLSSGQLLVGDEGFGVNTLRRYDGATGAVLSAIAVPAMYQSAAPNGGFEGMAVDPSSGAVWAINETALPVDNPSPDTGDLLRLQTFDASGQAGAQYAYRAVAAPGSFARGVAELLALPNGELLSLERIIAPMSGGGIGFHYSLFQLDVSGAADVSAIASLTGAEPTVGKTLLWQGALSTNYEGMELGELLADGSYSLLLVSEALGANDLAKVKALKINEVPLPAAAWLFLSALVGVAGARRSAARAS